MQDHFRVTQTIKRVQDRYNFSVPNVLLRAFWLSTVPQNQRDTLTELALGARGPWFESGRPDQDLHIVSTEFVIPSWDCSHSNWEPSITNPRR